MYKESWGLKRICPCNRIMYYDLGRKKLDCPDCGKPIEVTTLLRPRRGRKPGSVNVAPLSNPIPPKVEKKDDDLDIENLDVNADIEIIAHAINMNIQIMSIMSGRDIYSF